MFNRGVMLPVWALVFCALAFTPPRLTRSAIALLGTAVVAGTVPAIVRWWRGARSAAAILPAARQRRPANGRVVVAAGMRARTLDEAIAVRLRPVEDALDLVRMDDDGGWQRSPRRAFHDGSSDRQDFHDSRT
jgi:hypothetical protein